MTIEEMRSIDALKTYKELEEAKQRVRQLEEELNRANELYRKLNIHSLDLVDRIRRLEEAGAWAVLKAHLPDRLAAWQEANPGRVFDWNQIKKEEKP